VLRVANPDPNDPPARDRATTLLTTVLFACAALSVLAMVSTWGVGWMSDDWLILDRALTRSLVTPEPNHFSLPMALLWWIGGLLDSPIPARVVALACHLTTTLLVLPRTVRLLFPDWDPKAGRWVGLAVLCLSSCVEPLVWACTAGYAIVGLWVNLSVYAHLRWLETERTPWRFASLAAMAGGLLSWEMGVCTPALIVLASFIRRRTPLRSLRDAVPHFSLLVPYVLLKFLLGSMVTLAPYGALRFVGNIAFTPFLALSPWLLSRTHLVAAPGIALAALLLLAFFALAAKGRRRDPLALAAMGFAMLTPVIHGPGPEQRYLYLAAPWLLLATVAAVRAGAPTLKRPVTVALISIWCCLNTANVWRWAAGWREADRVAVQLVKAVVASVPPATEVALINTPDRLPGWGPTHKYWVFRFGLKQALARQDITLRAMGHWTPPDEETLGRRLHTTPVTSDLIHTWQQNGWTVIDCRPPPLEQVTLLKGSGE
jgi:hypothetical protein